MSDSSSDDDAPEMALMVMTKDGEKIKIKEFDNKKKIKKKYKRLKERDNAVVMLKNGKIKKQCGPKRKVVFLIAVAFGRGWCDFGPLDEDNSQYQIFTDDDMNFDGDDDSDDDDDDDDNFHLLRLTRDGTGIKDDEEPKRKKAEKKQKKAEKKGIISILTKRGNLRDYTRPSGEEQVCQLAFCIGCAYGRGLLEELGPFEDGGEYEILEEGFDLVESED